MAGSLAGRRLSPVEYTVAEAASWMALHGKTVAPGVFDQDRQVTALDGVALGPQPYREPPPPNPVGPAR